MHSPVPASHRPFNEQSKSEAHPTTADVPVSAKNIIIIIEIKIFEAGFYFYKKLLGPAEAREGVLTCASLFQGCVRIRNNYNKILEAPLALCLPALV